MVAVVAVGFAVLAAVMVVVVVVVAVAAAAAAAAAAAMRMVQLRRKQNWIASFRKKHHIHLLAAMQRTLCCHICKRCTNCMITTLIV